MHLCTLAELGTLTDLDAGHFAAEQPERSCHLFIGKPLKRHLDEQSTERVRILERAHFQDGLLSSSLSHQRIETLSGSYYPALAQEEDLIFSSQSSLEIAYVDAEAAEQHWFCTNSFCILRLGPQAVVPPAYIAAYLRSLDRTSITSYVGARMNELGMQTIPLPTTPQEQHQVARIAELFLARCRYLRAQQKQHALEEAAFTTFVRDTVPHKDECS